LLIYFSTWRVESIFAERGVWLYAQSWGSEAENKTWETLRLIQNYVACDAWINTEVVCAPDAKKRVKIIWFNLIVNHEHWCSTYITATLSLLSEREWNHHMNTSQQPSDEISSRRQLWWWCAYSALHSPLISSIIISWYVAFCSSLCKNFIHAWAYLLLQMYTITVFYLIISSVTHAKFMVSK